MVLLEDPLDEGVLAPLLLPEIDPSGLRVEIGATAQQTEEDYFDLPSECGSEVFEQVPTKVKHESASEVLILQLVVLEFLQICSSAGQILQIVLLNQIANSFVEQLLPDSLDITKFDDISFDFIVQSIEDDLRNAAGIESSPGRTDLNIGVIRTDFLGSLFLEGGQLIHNHLRTVCHFMQPTKQLIEIFANSLCFLRISFLVLGVEMSMPSGTRGKILTAPALEDLIFGICVVFPLGSLWLRLHKFLRLLVGLNLRPTSL